MKKQVTKITLALSFLSLAAFSQEGKVQPCNTYEAMEQHFADDPQARKNYEAAQELLNNRLLETDNTQSKTAAFEYTVPVVFHVLYTCGGQTITDAALIQALSEVNKDFSRSNADTSLIVQPFRSSYINSEIKFMLAKRDYLGNCINGIVRHEDPKTKWAQGAANGPGSDSYWTYTWDPTKYLNIYVVSEIVPQGTVTGGGIIVGYTYRPGTWPTGNPHDAIVYNMNYLTGTNAGIAKSRSLSHEIGHWLSLAHTFGNTNNPGTTCADDGITDTPVTKGEFGGCISSTISACTQTNPAMAGLNNVQNIMNYSDCPRNFTTGQTTNMRNALGAPVNGRNNLSLPATLAFTDVDGTISCKPKAQFLSTNCTYTVCKGGTLTFRDYSYNATVTATQWSADNGAIIANPTATLTSMTFPNIGIANVSFTASNSQGSDVKSVLVTVVDDTPSILGPYSESFEVPGTPTDWAVMNTNNDALTWQQTSLASYDQANSFFIEGALNPPNSVDILQMPMMDILHNQSSVLEFAYAYRLQSSSHTDVFRIQASKDCGGTWTDIYSPPATTWANGSGGISSEAFFPFSNEWKTYVVSGSPYWVNFKNSESVLVRFHFTEGSSGFGNNLFIDAISFTSPTGVNELTKSILFNLYPNPSTGEANVNFNLHDAASVKISVVDILGKEVLPAIENNFAAGEQNITINKGSTLSKGVYFVNLTFNGAKMSTKLVIN